MTILIHEFFPKIPIKIQKHFIMKYPEIKTGSISFG